MKSERLKNIFVVGDKVLIRAKSAASKTKSGLVLPPGYSEKEEVQWGYVIKTGPGYPVPVAGDQDHEAWKPRNDKESYVPLQARAGDLAVFIQKGAIEVVIEGDKYYIVPHHSLLLLERDEELYT